MKHLNLFLIALILSVTSFAQTPAPISGPTSICLGGSGTYADVTPGGIWSLSTVAVATISPTTGVLYGVAAGVTTLTYALPSSGLYTMLTITISPLPTLFSVTGGGAYCAGGAGVDVGLSGSAAGVMYQLCNGATPVGAAVAGTGVSLDFGMQTMPGVYTVIASNSSTSCSVNMTGSATVTVTSAPAAYTVTGGGSYCAGGSGLPITLSGSDAGVTYSLYDGSVFVTSMAGTGSGLSFGTYTTAGTYTVSAGSGCTSTMAGSATVAIGPAPAVYSVTGGGAYCSGSAGVNIGLDASDVSVNYQLYDGGVVVGSPIAGSGAPIDFGIFTASGTYTVVGINSASGCTSTMTSSATVTMSALPTVTATASSVGCNGWYALTASGATSYTWLGAGIDCTACATPNASPTTTTTYTVTGTDGSGCVNTATVTVDGNRIKGVITPAATGTIEVWLIQFNPSDSSITALDSTVACTSGGSQYYYFAAPASGNYLVKAYLEGGTPGASGYIPTYGASTPYWYSATGISHTSNTDSMNISMMYGTVPTGPGFISGYVASGAGRGTTMPPVVGLLIYLKDASGAILTHTYTDGSGNYSFTGLANGNYYIYPESYSFATTPSSAIVLTGAAESVSGVNFKQLDGSKTITPFDFTAVKTITASNALTVFPNPATNELNIQWNNQITTTANVSITDVTGRQVYSTSVNAKATPGTSQVSLDGITPGVYLLTIRNEQISYSSKLVVE